MLPQAALGALAGTLVSLLYTIGPDKPADPVVTREEAQAASARAKALVERMRR